MTYLSGVCAGRDARLEGLALVAGASMRASGLGGGARERAARVAAAEAPLARASIAGAEGEALGGLLHDGGAREQRAPEEVGDAARRGAFAAWSRSTSVLTSGAPSASAPSTP